MTATWLADLTQPRAVPPDGIFILCISGPPSRAKRCYNPILYVDIFDSRPLERRWPLTLWHA